VPTGSHAVWLGLRRSRGPGEGVSCQRSWRGFLGGRLEQRVPRHLCGGSAREWFQPSLRDLMSDGRWSPKPEWLGLFSHGPPGRVLDGSDREVGVLREHCRTEGGWSFRVLGVSWASVVGNPLRLGLRHGRGPGEGHCPIEGGRDSEGRSEAYSVLRKSSVAAAMAMAVKITRNARSKLIAPRPVFFRASSLNPCTA